MSTPAAHRPAGRLRWMVLGEGLITTADALFLVWLTLFVLDVDGAGPAVGLVLTVAALPRALLLLPAGLLVDRHDDP